MAIDEKPTAAWNEADLQELCDEDRREQPRLEFKSELLLDRDRDKRDVEEDIEGLANAGGGHVIYGLLEVEIVDGSKVAASLSPLSDGGLYERLNNHLDSRGDPRIPFEIYAIPAVADGLYIVIEVHGHRRPHMANDGRYYIRRNLLVRRMTEAEVADSYRQRFEREQQSLGTSEGSADNSGEIETRMRHGLTRAEQAAYQQETGETEPPGWLSAWVYPLPLRAGLLDPRAFNSLDFRNLQVEEIWREHPLAYMNLEKTNRGFIGRLPPRDDTYPH
jgi:hypothetical protein